MIPALTVTNDIGVADFNYLSIEKIKEEEIKCLFFVCFLFVLRMLEDWHFTDGGIKDKGGVGEPICLGTFSAS